MMSDWTKFHALETADRRLLVQAAALICVLHLGVRFVPFTTLRRWLDGVASPRIRRHVEVEAGRIGWAVRAAGTRVPGTTCLIEALAADVLLRRHRHSSSLRIGVRRGSSAPLDAHAWVECDGVPVVGTTPALAEYASLDASQISSSTASQTRPSESSLRG